MTLETVGKAIKHDSADLHVQGNATYIDDIREAEGTVHVAPGYAKQGARGKITKLDLSAVKNAPGVIAVLTAKDIPAKNDCSPTLGDDPIFADNEIQFHGQVIFAVVAETRDSARRATLLANIEIEQKTPAVTVHDALKEAKPDLLASYAFKKGDVVKLIKSSPQKISGSVEIGGQEHFYLEGQIAYAIPGEQGTMLVHSSTQHPTEIQHSVAAMLGIDDAKITAECRRMGGGFGGKESQATQWACLAALAAHKTGHPAKCRLDRDDDMMMTGKRHDFHVDYEASFDKTARITAVNVSLMAKNCAITSVPM